MKPRRAHLYTVGEPRPLREAEAALLTAMLNAKGETFPLVAGLKDALVQDMNDGGMGSLRFVGPENRHLGAVPTEAIFRDEDGVVVSAAVVLDRAGALYELDIWKVDFSPLIRIPPSEEIRIPR